MALSPSQQFTPAQILRRSIIGLGLVGKEDLQFEALKELQTFFQGGEIESVLKEPLDKQLVTALTPLLDHSHESLRGLSLAALHTVFRYCPHLARNNSLITEPLLLSLHKSLGFHDPFFVGFKYSASILIGVTDGFRDRQILPDTTIPQLLLKLSGSDPECIRLALKLLQIIVYHNPSICPGVYLDAGSRLVEISKDFAHPDLQKLVMPLLVALTEQRRDYEDSGELLRDIVITIEELSGASGHSLLTLTGVLRNLFGAQDGRGPELRKLPCFYDQVVCLVPTLVKLLDGRDEPGVNLAIAALFALRVIFKRHLNSHVGEALSSLDGSAVLAINTALEDFSHSSNPCVVKAAKALNPDFLRELMRKISSPDSSNSGAVSAVLSGPSAESTAVVAQAFRDSTPPAGGAAGTSSAPEGGR